MAKRQQHFPIDFQHLPPGWAHAPVGELAVSLRPGFASGKHTEDQVGVPHLRPMNISREGRLDLSVLKYVPEGNDLRVRAGDVLFNNTNSRELIGKTAPINALEYGFSNHMTRLRLPPSVDHRFVAYQLHYFWMSGYFRHLATQHVNQASISAGTLGSTVQLVVPPHAEQVKIADHVDREIGRLDATVAALQRVKTNSTEYWVLLIDLASRGRLLPPLKAVRRQDIEEAADELLRRIARERKQQSEQPTLFEADEAQQSGDQSKLQSSLPRGWTTATLAELASDWSYGTSVKSDYGAKGPPVLRIPNVVNVHLDLSDLKRATKAEGLTEDKQLEPGDFLIIRTNGSKSLIGRAAVVIDPFSQPHFFASYLIRFRLLGSPTLWRWISMVWASSPCRAAIESVAWTTAGQYNVNLRNLGAIKLPIPPEREQQRILQEVDAQSRVLDRLNTIISENLQRAADLRFTIMDRAFKGQLVRSARPKRHENILEHIREELGALRQEEADRHREEQVAKRQARSSSPSTASPRRDILVALKHSKAAIKVDDLFELVGYSFEERDDVDAFYEQLSAAVREGRAAVVRRTKDASFIKALP